MVRPQYPLKALRKLRDERAEAQAQELARQVARSSAAAATLAERELRRREHERHVAEVVGAERERLASGQLTAADLRKWLDFEAGARERAEALRAAEADARRSLERELAEEQGIREQLARLEADAQLARNHEMSFHQKSEAAESRADEEAALEQWNARHR